MNAFLEEVAVMLGAQPAISETDREIIETMIEIGAEPAEIAETFGYAPEQIDAVVETSDTPEGDIPTALLRLPAVRR